MRTTTLLLASSLILANVLPAQGQQQPRPLRPLEEPSRGEKRDARSFRQLRIPGEEVARNVKRLRKELRWHKTLGGALASGRSSGKPILWVQALGDLGGFL